MGNQKRTARPGGDAEWGKTTLGNDFYEANDLRTHGAHFQLIGIYPRERKTSDDTGTYVPIFTAALFLIAPNRKPSSCLSTTEGMQEPAGPCIKWIPLFN